MQFSNAVEHKHSCLSELAKYIATRLDEDSAEDRIFHSLLYIVEELIDKLQTQRLRAAFWNVLSSDTISCHYELAACLHEMLYFASTAMLTEKVVAYIAAGKKEDPEKFFISLFVELISLIHEEERVLNDPEGYVDTSAEKLQWYVYNTYYDKLRTAILITLEERRKAWNTKQKDEQSTSEKEKEDVGTRS